MPPARRCRCELGQSQTTEACTDLILCLNDCRGKGRCVRGVCVCDQARTPREGARCGQLSHLPRRLTSAFILNSAFPITVPALVPPQGYWGMDCSSTRDSSGRPAVLDLGGPELLARVDATHTPTLLAPPPGASGALRPGAR